MSKKEFVDLKKEVASIQKRHPALSADNAFVLWFAHAFLTDDEAIAVQTVVGGSGDIGADAIYIDTECQKAYLVQAKYHTSQLAPLTPSKEVLKLAELGKAVVGPKKSFEALLRLANPQVRERMEQVRHATLGKGFRLSLLFATSGRIAADLEYTCYDIGDGAFEFEAFDRSDLLRLLSDYEEGVAPPTPTVTLPVSSDTILKRTDESRNITSWIFAVNGGDVARLVRDNAPRIFSRNIRGHLGSSDINKDIQATLKKAPHDFWYFNNGLTIVCDDAKKIEGGSQLSLRITSPQIINGQQTAYALAKHGVTSANVLTRVISIPRCSHDDGSYDAMVGKIVQATNWQNAILPSDLVSNDSQQVRIERELRKRYYAYLRKRQAKGEARRHLKFQPVAVIAKQELAQAIGACVLDPFEVRSGKERLFEPDPYAKIFCGRPISEYLMFYWLGRAARERGKQTITRPYAKWVVLGRMYAELRSAFSSSSARERFVTACEASYWYDHPLKPLMAAFDCLYRAAEGYYKKNRLIDGELYDHSLFYKREGHDVRFAEFWNNGNHGQRGTFKKKIVLLKDSLIEFEDALAA